MHCALALKVVYSPYRNGSVSYVCVLPEWGIPTLSFVRVSPSLRLSPIDLRALTLRPFQEVSKVKPKVTELVEEMVSPILSRLGLLLVEVEYKKEGANWMLRVFIDRPDGAVDLDDCAIVSENLSVALDERDPIPNAYFLEVSSAGAERPLKRPQDFERSIGKRVHVSLYEPIDGRKAIEGTLLSYGEGELSVASDNAAMSVPLAKVAGARLAIEW